MRRYALSLLVPALVLAACNANDAPEPAPSQPPAGKGVSLTLDRDTARPGETLQLTVHNRTNTRLEYGVAYRLERFVDGDWRWVNRDSAFVLILKFVEPGGREREEIGLGDLEPGRYRIVKSFTAPDQGRRLDASVEFRVR